MSATIPARRIRIAADLASPLVLKDLRATDNTVQQSPVLIRGASCDVEVGIFYDEELADIGDIAEVYLQIWYGSTLLVDKTLDDSALNAAVTAESWADNTAAHAVFELSNADLNIALSNLGNPEPTIGTKVQLEMEITALMVDGRENPLVIGTCYLLIRRRSVSGTPELTDDTYYTQTAADALFQLHEPDTVAKNPTLRGADGNNYRLGVAIIDSVATITLEQTAV